MRKHIVKSFLAMLVVTMLVAIGVTTLSATTYTYTAGTAYKVTLPNGSFLYRFQFEGNGKSQQDTLVINLPAVKPGDMFRNASDTTLYVVNVYTSDSSVIGIRWQVSSDNTTFESYTIGTDSTTWYPGAYDLTTVGIATFPISAPQYTGFPQPYNRLKIVGVKHASRALYGWVGSIKVDVIPQNQ